MGKGLNERSVVLVSIVTSRRRRLLGCRVCVYRLWEVRLYDAGCGGRRGLGPWGYRRVVKSYEVHRWRMRGMRRGLCLRMLLTIGCVAARGAVAME